MFGVDTLRRELIDSAGLQSGQRVLDVGCGTGTLVIAAKRACPAVELIGLDPDPRALERARRKAARAGVDVRFDRGYGDALPYPVASFARVFSSLMLHHLDPATQRGLLAEVRRVLEPGGNFHLMDFVHSNHGLHGLFRGTHRGALQPHFEPEQELLAQLQQAGFIDVRPASAAGGCSLHPSYPTWRPPRSGRRELISLKRPNAVRKAIRIPALGH